MRKINILKDETAQVLVIFALLTTILILFTGLAIDSGILYVTKAKLSAAVDGACLAGMKNLRLGQPTATQVATDIFNANYGANPPTPSISFPIDQYDNQYVQVSATVYVHTLFMQIVPAFAIVPVSDSATSTKNKLIMTIVLDRSGSMGSPGNPNCGNDCDGGMAALQVAVPAFVANFDSTDGAPIGDQVGLVSFSSDSSIDVPVEYHFQSDIDNAVAAMQADGGTFGTGVGTGQLLSQTQGPPLTMAGNMNNAAVVNQGQNVIKVVVYLTDGLMNTIQDNFYCHGKSNQQLTLLNYGGFDASEGTNAVAPQDYTQPANVFYPVYDPDSNGCNGWFQGQCSNQYFGYDSKGHPCKDNNGNYVTTFPSQQYGKQVQLSRQNVTQEAQWRALQTSAGLELLSQTHPNFVYTIGLGQDVNPSTQKFLANLANDPNPQWGGYNQNQTQGEFFYITPQQCPGTGNSCAEAVKAVFQTIAAKILLRLTQ
ncbi:MAG TPA: TadE/TadG family type IV pilus assembly protein [Terriglobales bacterium]|nr:TadE/TadG family type IV pilus assembly protein [Terriglobales bacterium]